MSVRINLECSFAWLGQDPSTATIGLVGGTGGVSDPSNRLFSLPFSAFTGTLYFIILGPKRRGKFSKGHGSKLLSRQNENEQNKMCKYVMN